MSGMTLAEAKQAVRDELEKHKDAILELNHAIHADPEISWEEHRAVERIATFLHSNQSALFFNFIFSIFIF